MSKDKDKSMVSDEENLDQESNVKIEDTAEEEAPAPEEEFSGPIELTGEEYKTLKEKAAKADEHWDRLLRERAELDNFKKRAARDRSDAIKYANEELLERLIPLMDNFEMALQAAESTENTSLDSIRTGVKMIHGQLKSFLKDYGLEEIDAIGKKFDHNLHEAISQQDTDEHEEETVLQQARKGYKLRDRLLRPASVIVARKPATESEGE